MGNQQGLGKSTKQQNQSFFTNLCRGDALMTDQMKEFQVNLQAEEINQNQQMIEMNGSKDHGNKSKTQMSKTHIPREPQLSVNTQQSHISTKIRRVTIQKKNQSSTQSIQKESSQKQHSSQQKFQQRIKDSLQYFKSLKVLQFFETKYKRQYPVLILSKQKKTKELRREIMAAKEKHQYFQQGKGQQLMINEERMLQGHEYQQGQHERSKQIYHMYQTLQKLQKNIIRIFQTGKHHSILTHIKTLDQNISSPQSQFNAISRLQSFVTDLNSINIEFMDMLYYQLSQQNQSSARRYSVRSISDRQVVNVKKMIMDQKEGKSQQYEEMKAVGFELYKNSRVVFVVMLGKNDSYLLQPYFRTYNQPNQHNIQHKQTLHRFFHPLNLPNNISLLQLLMSRYNAFAQLIQVPQLTIMLFFNPCHLEQLTKIIQARQTSWPKLNIITLKQSTIPLLDLQGNLVISQNNDIHNGSGQLGFLKSTNGSGDLWDFLKEKDNELGLRYLFNAGYQYVQVIQMGNCLQSGFDCFMLGYAHDNKLDWTTKVVQPVNRALIPHHNTHNQTHYNMEESILYRTTTSEIVKIDPSENKYPQILQHLLSQQRQFYTPTDHSIFSVQYIRSKILNNSWQKEVSYRKKLINQNSHNRQLIIFEKNLSDIFNNPLQSLRSSRIEQYAHRSNAEFNYRLFLCQRQQEYYPLLYFENADIYDLQSCSRALSQHYLRLLDISVERYLGCSSLSEEGNLRKVKCYIDPRVSLQGQNLEEVKVQIEKRINAILLLVYNVVQQQDVENYSRVNERSVNRTYADYIQSGCMKVTNSRVNEINANSSYTTPFKCSNANKLHDHSSKGARSGYYYESQNKECEVSSEIIRSISSIQIQRRESVLQQQNRQRQSSSYMKKDNYRPQVNIMIS